ncbi:ribosomal protein S18 acetylase RimI-like enzyme [Paenarthrobacter sp. TE4293]|uniref:GNAT family N-acetyltransferase n=1 Tax=Paenarthrobacter sp. TE4293 TaxID=3381695 RepID=UPI003D2237FF
MIQQALLETLMDKAWPALEREVLEQDGAGEWVLRASGGVTQRANSVWPGATSGVSTTDRALERLVRSASDWYRHRRLPLIFQVFDDARNAALNDVLDRQRFTRQSETKIMVRGVDGVPSGSANVEILDHPTDEWLRLWWAVDGRGGDAELSVAHKILTGCPSLYALVRDDDGAPAAVGRLALVDGWGGIYSMATSAPHRRRGHGATVLAALVKAGAALDLKGFWLLVTAANHGAQSLYTQSGFTDYGSYLYRQAPLKRQPSGC